MALFNRISDPRIGCTYMTLLNTVANLAFKWPNSAVFFLVSGSTLKNQQGEVIVDGFYIWCAICTVFGLVWFQQMNSRMTELQYYPDSDWRVSDVVGQNRHQPMVQNNTKTKLEANAPKNMDYDPEIL